MTQPAVGRRDDAAPAAVCERSKYDMENQTVNATTSKLGPVAALIALFVFVASAPAWAQGDMPTDPDVDEEELEEEAEDALPDLDDDDPMYWAEMREVYAMQQRAFHKEGRLSATLYSGLIPNNIFEQYFPVGMRLNYYLMENIGLELSGSYNFVRSTRLNDIIVDEDGISAQNRPLIGDTQVSHVTTGVKWSPVYGKFTFMEDRLFYFDMYAFGGAGMVVSQTQTEYGPEEDTVGTTVKPEGVLGGGLAVYAGQHAGIRADFRQFIFQKVNPPGGVANPSEVSIGFSWFF